jgi:hypothetical protein
MATYLLSILPCTTINNYIPHVFLYNTKPNYMSLRVFGCLCYAHLYFNHKPGPQSTPFIFLGYPSNHRGFRCLNVFTNKIIISRNVTFDESFFHSGSSHLMMPLPKLFSTPLQTLSLTIFSNYQPLTQIPPAQLLFQIPSTQPPHQFISA